MAGPHSEAGIDVMPGVSPLIINTISIGSIGPAVRLADGVLDPVIEHCILGSAGATARANLVVEGPAAAEIRLASHATNLLEGVAPEDLFQDYEARDLDLSPNSMARNFGTEQLAPSEDIDRLPLDVSIDRIDVGAYEYPGLENGVDATWAIYQ